MSSPFAALRGHPLYIVARQLQADGRPRRRRHVGPPIEALNPHYAYAGRNEQATLEELVAAEPPKGGMAAYIAELDKASNLLTSRRNIYTRAHDRCLPHPDEMATDRQVAMFARWWE
jgi:hypothetical protein